MAPPPIARSKAKVADVSLGLAGLDDLDIVPANATVRAWAEDGGGAGDQ